MIPVSHRVAQWGLRAAVAMMVAVTACGRERGGEAGQGAMGTRREGGRVSALDVSLATTKPSYSPREPITFTLNVRNPTDRPITLRFASGQRYDFVIEDERGATVWRWAADRAFAQAVREQTVPPGWELNYNERFAGQLAPGVYRVRGLITAMQDSLEANAEITVRH